MEFKAVITEGSKTANAQLAFCAVSLWRGLYGALVEDICYYRFACCKRSGNFGASVYIYSIFAVEMINTYGPTALVMASKLLEIGAVQFNDKKPFTWSSGWKSPIYCDNRICLSYPPVRNYIRESLTALISERFGTTECIAGVATAGIPYGVLVADKLGLPYVYVRSSPKGHGMRNQIEGCVEKGKKVVLVEDLISTGGSSLRAAAALDKAGFVVMSVVAIFTYGFEAARRNIESAKIPLFCLSDFEHLLDVLARKGHFNESQLAHLKSWRLNPDTWG